MPETKSGKDFQSMYEGAMPQTTWGTTGQGVTPPSATPENYATAEQAEYSGKPSGNPSETKTPVQKYM